MAHEDPQVWALAYDQLPPMMRWLVAVLGIFSTAAAGWILRRYNKRLEDLEKAKFMTREEHAAQQEILRREIHEGFRSTHQRIDNWYERKDSK